MPVTLETSVPPNFYNKQNLIYVQSKGRKETMKAIKNILNYAGTQPNKKIIYHKSGVILHIHRNGFHLSAPKAHIQVGGDLFLPERNIDPKKCKHNGAVQVITKIILKKMVSAAESEIVPTYVNAQESVPIRTYLI